MHHHIAPPSHIVRTSKAIAEKELRHGNAELIAQHRRSPELITVYPPTQYFCILKIMHDSARIPAPVQQRHEAML